MSSKTSKGKHHVRNHHRGRQRQRRHQRVAALQPVRIIGGGLWAVWGVITLAGGLKDQNGPATQSGVWQVVGGGLIIAAAALFSNIAL